MISSKEGREKDCEKDLSILTERQRTAYLLRLEKKTYTQIAIKMGITTSAVGQLIHHAERRFREYEKYNASLERNNISVDLPLTRGELIFILSGLRLLEAELEKGVAKGLSYDWKGRLPYEHGCVETLSRRIQSTLYGKVIYGYEKDEQLE